MGVNFLYYPIEFALTLSFQAFTKEFILSWEVINKVIFAICIDPSSTINPTKFLLANIVILFNLFPLVCLEKSIFQCQSTFTRQSKPLPNNNITHIHLSTYSKYYPKFTKSISHSFKEVFLQKRRLCQDRKYWSAQGVHIFVGKEYKIKSGWKNFKKDKLPQGRA